MSPKISTRDTINSYYSLNNNKFTPLKKYAPNDASKAEFESLLNEANQNILKADTYVKDGYYKGEAKEVFELKEYCNKTKQDIKNIKKCLSSKNNLKIENYLYSFKVNSRELNLRVLPLSVVNTLSGKNKYFNDELQAIKKYKVGLNPKEEYKLSINDAYILVRRAEQFIKNIETESADDIISITNWRDEVLKNIAIPITNEELVLFDCSVPLPFMFERSLWISKGWVRVSRT